MDPDKIPPNEIPSMKRFNVDLTKPAGFWIRFVAYLIDQVILVPLLVITMFIETIPVIVIVTLLSIAYKPVLEGIYSATVGKMVLNLKVIDEDGSSINFPAALLRAAVFILPSILGLATQVKALMAGIDRSASVEQQQAFFNDNLVLYMLLMAASLALIISCVTAAFSRHKRALHDMMAATYVVYKS